MKTRLLIPLFSSPWAVVGLAALLCLASPVVVAAQGGVYGGGMFELGDAEPPPGMPGVADILGSEPQAGPDWDDLFAADGSPRDDYPYDESGQPLGNGVHDYLELWGGQWVVFTADDVSLGSGFEGTALTADGRVVNGVVEADHDIGNAYVYSTLDGAGNAVVYAAAERLGSGDSTLEFEFNQGHMRLGHGGFGVGAPWEIVGGKTLGDLRAALSFAGGALSSVALSVWDGAAWIGVDSLAGEGCNGAESLCAVANADVVDGGSWPNFDTGGSDPEQISANRFVEVGINVGAVVGPVDFTTVCIRSPQDTAFGYFAEGN
ncbi:MAG: hypothetical protein OEP45_12255 [Acidobacteriota bacterium]|nr:hypothetical protein [Acidobacteriota bacterium]